MLLLKYQISKFSQHLKDTCFSGFLGMNLAPTGYMTIPVLLAPIHTQPADLGTHLPPSVYQQDHRPASLMVLVV